ncbi:MAG: thiamine diphosphokinase [Candidatus Kryptonium sp.]
MKALLICNGDMPSRNFLMSILGNYDFIACADGGANLAYKLKIQPNFIIGDLDSIEEKVKNFFQKKGSEIILDTDQDSTDIEKSVKFLINRGYTSIDIVSALGDRIDHNLGNLSVLVNFHKKAKLRIIWESGEIFFVTGKFSFEVNKGDVISLVPLGRKAFVSKTLGLKFKLKNENLVFSGKGISNVAVANKVSIYVKQGGVFVIRKIVGLKV